MKRCQSWRRGKHPHDRLHSPGECHRCWQPCRERVGREGDVRCASCVQELVNAPEAWVRLALANEESANDEVIQTLSEDGESSVHFAARRHRERRDVPVSTPAVVPTQTRPARRPLPIVVSDDDSFEPLVIDHGDDDEW
jgi:hypothetical protein